MLLVGALSLAIFWCRYLEQGQLFFYLASGKNLCRHGFTGNEPLSLALADLPYSNHLWISELTLYWLYSLVGISAPWLLTVLAFAGCLYCSGKIIPGKEPARNKIEERRRQGAKGQIKWVSYFLPAPKIAAWQYLAFGAIVVLTAVSDCRSRILWLIYLQASAFIWLSYRFYTHGADHKTTAALLALQILWRNSHPSFFLGPVVFLVMLVAEKFLGQRERPAWTNYFFSAPKSMAVLTLLTICCLLAPQRPFAIYQGPWEWLSQASLVAWPGYWIFLGTAVLVGFIRRRHAVTGLLLIAVLWNGLALVQSQWLVPAVLVTLSALAGTWSPAPKQPGVGSRLLPIAAVIIVVGITIAAPLGFDRRYFGRWGQGIDHRELPVAAADFLRKVPASGQLYNDFSLGQYLAWAQPHRIFIDARARRSAPKLIEELTIARHFPHGFADLIRRFDLRIALFDHRLPASDKLLGWMRLQPEWHLVYYDHIAALFVRNAPALTGFISAHKIYDAFSAPGLLAGNPAANADLYYQRARAALALHLPQRSRYDIELGMTNGGSKTTQAILQGRLALLGGDLERAAERFRQAIAGAGANPEPVRLLVQTDLRLGSPAALQEAQRWCERSRNWADLQLKFCHAQLAHSKSDTATARMLLQQILQKYPWHQEARRYLQDLEQQISNEALDHYLQRSKKLVQAKEPRQALKILQRALAIDAKFAEAHIEAGKICLDLHRYQAAAEHFRQVLQLAPGNVLANCKLAIAVAALGQWQAALQILQPLRQRLPDRYDVREAAFQVDRIAIERLQASLQLNFDYDAARQLCRLMQGREQFAAAITFLKPFTQKVAPAQLDPWQRQLARLYYESGRRLIQHKQVKEGMAQLRRSIEIFSDFFEAHLLLGVIALKMQDWPKAARHFRRLIAIAPKDERGPQGLALIGIRQRLKFAVARRIH